MRQIILDTETTGLYPEQGHRIIELAAVEVVNRRPTGRTLHFRIDPERDIDAAATEVHGLTWDDLKGRPRFRDVAGEFLDFVRGAEWVIHNAAFDIAFLDAELRLADMPCCASTCGKVIDTLAMARDAFPGKRNNLDALCERFGVHHAHRILHGALLDAELLAEVYLAMTRGQETLTIDMATSSPITALAGAATSPLRLALSIIAPSEHELAEHRAYLTALDRDSKGRCVWLGLERAPAPEAQDPVLLPEAEAVAA
ncbi:MAG: DNA polymerase III subunit epsilon [Pseudomonadota bacterium]|nr:DNA polymerase III subunit epsilon [Pseudomonadota bacterium]